MAQEQFYQAIMKVPGLTGNRYQDRGRDLYYKLGAPFGAYKGNLKQNSWLLNQIRNNNYYYISILPESKCLLWTISITSKSWKFSLRQYY